MLEVLERDASVVERKSPLSAPPRAGDSARKRLMALGIGLLVLAGLALLVDLPIAQFVAAHELPGEFRRLVRLSEAFAWGGTVALIIAAACILDPRGWRIAPRLALSAFGAGLLANVVKLLIGRLRPAAANLEAPVLDTFATLLPSVRAESLGLTNGHALQSFPSGHAATAAGLAVALSVLYPRGRWLFAALAVLACLQRIEGQAHFLSDVLTGAALGCLVGAVCAIRRASRG
jgi:membrane-associated phospholipid phosphatase